MNGTAEIMVVYILFMPKEPKSPQEKKRLAYAKDHFSPGEHSSSRHSWRRKKTSTNRQYRRKTEELFTVVKPGMAGEDVSQATEDLTVGRVQDSVPKKKLRKWGVIALAEKVPLTLERRGERIDRRKNKSAANRNRVTEAIETLTSLEGDQLVQFVRRFAFLYRGGDPVGYQQMYVSKDPLDRAFVFLYELRQGRGSHREILCNNDELKAALDAWAVKANRILARDQRAFAKKSQEKQKIGKKINALRRFIGPAGRNVQADSLRE